jgi:hypothetical protein
MTAIFPRSCGSRDTAAKTATKLMTTAAATPIPPGNSPTTCIFWFAPRPGLTDLLHRRQLRVRKYSALPAIRNPEVKRSAASSPPGPNSRLQLISKPKTRIVKSYIPNGHWYPFQGRRQVCGARYHTRDGDDQEGPPDSALHARQLCPRPGRTATGRTGTRAPRCGTCGERRFPLSDSALRRRLQPTLMETRAGSGRLNRPACRPPASSWIAPRPHPHHPHPSRHCHRARSRLNGPPGHGSAQPVKAASAGIGDTSRPAALIIVDHYYPYNRGSDPR